MSKRRFPAVLLAIVTAAGFLIGTSLGVPAGAKAAAIGEPDKGPVGWEVYRQLDRLPELTSGVETREFSSFDRTGGNDDGPSGTYSCLRQTPTECVIAEARGAGELDTIWFGGNVDATTTIRIELDGKVVLDGSLFDVVDGKLGPPFVFPLVANQAQSSGGVVLRVPMPYRQSMLVMTNKRGPLSWYNVSYRKFADAVGVSTFDPSDKALDVIDKLRAAGTADPKGAPQNASTSSRDFSLAPGERTTVANLEGPGVISALQLRMPQIQAAPQQDVYDDGRAFGRDANAYSQFTMKINPDNQGVRLTRRLDAGIGHQVADVYVDGQKAAQWAPNTPQSGCRWLNESVDLPASVTAGKSQITIRNQFVSSDNDYNELYYWAYSDVGGSYQQTDALDLGPSHTSDEAAHSYSNNQQTWQGAVLYCYPPDAADEARVAPSNDVLRNTDIQITFDGQRTVDAPLGEFFGSGLGAYQVKSLMTAMSTAGDGWYSAWWPMPFAHTAKVELVNHSAHAITAGESRVTMTKSSGAGPGLSQNGALGYFHATSHAGETTPGSDWLFLNTGGQGKFVGVSETMQGPDRSYLEGDERVYVDGSRTPQMYGTGTEDFYQGSYYFNRGPFTNPLSGNTAHQIGGYGCQYDCTATYRLMLSDAVPFASSLRFGMEHGGDDLNPAHTHYTSTAYWYGRSDYGLRQTDTLDVGDTASERSHGYTSQSPGNTAQLTSVFEGNFDTSKVTHDVRATSAPVSFTLGVDAQNQGVVLRRMSDQQNAYQEAEVYVNGQDLGVWFQPLGNQTQRWLEDTFQLPASVTAGRSRLKITLVPLGGTPSWSAARYEALSRVGPFPDHQPPSRVNDLIAEAGRTNQVTLSWSQAADNVAVSEYEVYGSRNPNFTPGADTLLGRTAGTTFVHNAGLRETWYYQVRAVDYAANSGPLSARVSAATGSLLWIEAESLLPPIEATAPAEVQYDCCGITRSGGAQIFFTPAGPNQHFTVAFNVPNTGTYDLSSILIKAPDYGIHTLAVDGTVIGKPSDGYNPIVALAGPVDYGEVQLAAGQHTLTLIVTGKNPSSRGYFAGVDVFELELRS